MATNVKIATITIPAGGQQTATFSNIPADFTDLKIIVSAKSTDTGAQGQYMYFNGINSDVSSKYQIASDSSVSGGDLSYMYVGSAFGTNGTSGVFNNTEIYIPNYLGSQYKCYSARNVAEANTNTTFINMIAGICTNNTNAITSISISTQGSNVLIENSTFTLYGINKK